MISQPIKDQIISKYLNGSNISKLSREYKISERSITIWLKKADIKIRKTNGRELYLDKQLVNDMYNSGRSTYDLANHFKCSDETIRKLIDNIRPYELRNRHTEYTKQKISKISKDLWNNLEYVSKVKAKTQTADYKERLRAASKKYTHLTDWCKSDFGKKQISMRMKQVWKDEEYRNNQALYYAGRIENISKLSRLSLADPIKNEAWRTKLRANSSKLRDQPGYVSLPQQRLYEYLKLSGITYYEEGDKTRISDFYVVDCIIPKQMNMQRDLIIEVQGEYWHALNHVKTKDTQKSTYIKNHTDYDLLYLTDLDTKSYLEVTNNLTKYGIKLSKINCSVKELELRGVANDVAERFISLHHYLERARNGAYYYGAFKDNELMWIIGYSYPIRLEAAKKQGFNNNQVLEISRIARLPNLICKNLGSYMIRKTISLLPKEIKMIITYADHTEGHTGAVYKAAGFTYDGDVEPSYYYKSANGKYHKKTIWDRSKKFLMTESEYAAKHNLIRVDTLSKARYILRLK